MDFKFPHILCEKHKKSIYYFNTNSSAKLQERCWCMDCEIIKPITINEALKHTNQLLESSTKVKIDIEQLKSNMIELKNSIIEKIEQQFIEIQCHINNLQSQILDIDRILLYESYGKAYNLKDLQSLGQLLFVKDENDQTLIKILKQATQSRQTYQHQICKCLQNLQNHISSNYQIQSIESSQYDNQTSDKQQQQQQQQSNKNSFENSGRIENIQVEDKEKSEIKIQQPVLQSKVTENFQDLSQANLNGEAQCSIVLPNSEIFIGKKQDKINQCSTLECLKFTGQQIKDRLDKNEINSEGVTSLFYNDKLKHILVGGQDGNIYLYQIEPLWTYKMKLWEYSGKIQSIFSYSNTQNLNEFVMLSCGQNIFFKCFKITNFREQELFSTKLPDQIMDLLVFNENNETAILTQKGLVIYELNSWKEIQKIDLETSLCGVIVQNKIIIGQQSGILLILGKQVKNYEILQSLKLANQILQVQYLIKLNYLLIRDNNKILIVEFNNETYEYKHKQTIDGNYSHILTIQSQEIQAIGLCQKEPKQILIYK